MSPITIFLYINLNPMILLLEAWEDIFSCCRPNVLVQISARGYPPPLVYLEGGQCCLIIFGAIFNLVFFFFFFKVELTKRCEVYIPTAVKNQIKVDFTGQPKRLLMETLFALYGQDSFEAVTVTARGNKAGTYGIEPNVLKAVYSVSIKPESLHRISRLIVHH